MTLPWRFAEEVETGEGSISVDGVAIPVRVPIPTGSIVDLTVEASRATSAEEINAAFDEHADVGALEGILAYSEEPLVSTDVVASPYSAVFDAPLTSVVGGSQVKVIAWYDNEWGYSNRLVELATKVLVEQPVLAR